MATTFNGIYLDDRNNGLTDIGDDGAVAGVGSLTVNGGDTLDLTSTNLANDLFQVLRVGDGSGANGTVTIDAASKILFTSNGLDDTASGLQIGRNGGTGLMTIAGGTFQISDPSTLGVDTANDYDDEEFVAIGRHAGSNGTLNVSAGGSFLIEGNSVNMQIAREGGTGSATFTGGSHFNLTAGGAGTDSGVLIRVGNNAGSVGTLSFDGSDGVLQANPDNSAGFVIGLNGGQGDFQLLNGSQFTVNGGANGAHGAVGQGSGGDGTLTLDGASSLTFQGGTGDNGLNIGRDGGAGSVDMTAGSTLTATSQVGAYLNVGQDAGSLGTVNVLGSTISLQGTGSGDAGAEIGARDGTGTLNLNGLTTLLDVNAAGFAYLNVGREGGFGVLNANAGTISMSGGEGANAAIGAYGGIGQVMLDGATWNVTSANNFVAISIGHDGAADGTDSGTGRMTLRNGATVNFNHADGVGSSFSVGGGAGSVAQLYVTSGSVIDMDVTNSGASFSDLLIGYRGATALVVIDGPGAEIRHADFIGIGYQAGDSYSKPGGHGALQLRNGAQITVDDIMVVGAGGLVGGLNASINGNVNLSGGGHIDLRDGRFGNFDVNGNVFIEGTGNQILLEIGANDGNPGTQDGDLIRFNSDFDSSATGQFSVTVEAFNGFKFTAGEQRIVAETNGGGNSNQPTFAVTGQHADFAFYAGGLPTFGANEIVVEALNSGLTGGLGIVDFLAASPGATVSYNATANNGFVDGGRFDGTVGNIDQFLGTNSADSLRITTAGNGSRGFTLDGRGGVDNLLGGAGVDTLIGGAGGDTLDGGLGGDTMLGGLDNDTYFVNSTLDTVSELGGTGTADIVRSSISLSLLNSARLVGVVENLTLLNVATALNGTGSNGNNVITGNNFANILTGNGGIDTLNGGIGNDTLAGGLANDTLTGGAGNDYFVFNTALAANRDSVADFANLSGNNDTFRLENAIFTKLAAVGGLNPAFFKAGAAAADANDYIVYNKLTGALFYDSNGNGAGGAIQFATLATKPTLTSLDFAVI